MPGSCSADVWKVASVTTKDGNDGLVPSAVPHPLFNPLKNQFQKLQVLGAVMTGCIHCISWNETHVPLLSTSSPLSLKTFSSVPLLHPLFPNLLCSHILLHMCHTRALSCSDTGPGASTEWSEIAITGIQECMTPVAYLPESCRTACGLQCGQKPPPLPCSMLWCDACPWYVPLAKHRHGDKDGTEGGGRTANGCTYQSRVGSFVNRHSWHQKCRCPDGLPNAPQRFHQENARNTFFKNGEFRAVLFCMVRLFGQESRCKITDFYKLPHTYTYPKLSLYSHAVQLHFQLWRCHPHKSKMVSKCTESCLANLCKGGLSIAANPLHSGCLSLFLSFLCGFYS